jgi:hypothetical protein
MVIFDELGQCKGPRPPLYEALETATGAQRDPLTIVISTQARSDNDLLSVLIDDALGVASINVQTQRHSVTLKYRSRSYGEDWSDVEQRVTIAWTPCRFGGERPWFVCSLE